MGESDIRSADDMAGARATGEHSATAAPVVWYAVRTKVHAERMVAESLGRKEFEIYLPTAPRLIKHARRQQLVARPLFPRYLFVAFRVGQPGLWEVGKTWGVDWLITNPDTGRPVQIPRSAIAEVRRIEQVLAGEAAAAEARGELPKPGELVRILGGPFNAVIAEVLTARSESRIEILIRDLARVQKPRLVVPLAKIEHVA